MLEAIPPQLVGGAGLATIVLAAVWSMLTGRIVSRAAHEDRIRDKDDHIAYLRATLETRDQEAAIRTEQVQKLLTNSDLTVQLLQALNREARSGDVAA